MAEAARPEPKPESTTTTNHALKSAEASARAPSQTAPALTTVKPLVMALGPGLITGASDDDPSGIATYAVAGASLGFAPLWTALITFPMMAAVQFMAAKIGMVSGRGLAGVLRRHYSKPIVYAAVIALFIANTINVGADLGAIAEALAMLLPLRASMMVLPVAALIVAIQIVGSYRLIARTFKWLTLTLLAYIGAALFAHPDAAAVLRGTLVPTVRLDATYLATLVGLLGTTISPYLFFWQAGQEVEEEAANGRRTVRRRRGASDAELRYAAWDVVVGMLLSNVVMYFIILATAATLFRSGPTEIETATQAAEALRPLAGDAASVLFALGLVGSGFLAVPILTGSAAYAVSELVGWRWGLRQRPKRAKEFYMVLAIATLLGTAMNFVDIGAVAALFWSAVINGFVAPGLLAIIVLTCNNSSAMGTRTNGRLLNVLGWATTGVMAAAAVGLVATWLIR